MTDKKDDIVLMMVSFFINEMIEDGITTKEEISNFFETSNEKAFKKMIKEYKDIQTLTRNKAIKKIIELKKVISRYQSK